MIKKVDEPNGGGSNFTDPAKKRQNTLAIVAVLVVIGFVIAFIF